MVASKTCRKSGINSLSACSCVNNHKSLQLRIDVGVYGFGGSMLLTFSEAVERLGSRHFVRKAVRGGLLHPISRGLYSLDETDPDPLAIIAAKHPNAVVTGLTALYVHGLVDSPPEKIDLATKRGGTKINDPLVHQYAVPAEWLNLGRTEAEFDGAKIAVYDLERMLLELMRSRNKLPYDLYREAVSSYRRRADKLDIYKLQDYSERMPRGESHLARAMKEVF